MNYVRAVKGPGTRTSVLEDIDAQSEVELGRLLDLEEKELLFNKFSSELVLRRIQQVLYKFLNPFLSNPIVILVWLWSSEVFDVCL